MFDVIGKRRWFFAFSLLITIPGLIFIFLTPFSGGTAGLKFSIDYTGGTTWSIRFADPGVTTVQVRDELAALDQRDATVALTGAGFFDIRLSKLDLRTIEPLPTAVPTLTPPPTTEPTSSSDPSASPSPAPTAAPLGNTQVPTDGEIGRIATGLQAELGPIAEQRSLSSIGAVVSADLINQAVVLILIGSLGILAWITFRFRDVKMGVTALVSLVHDVIVVLGFFAILGTFFDTEIDGLFVTAMLTVIGFSVHDTIVVFDRVRENRVRHAGEPFAEIVNHSLLQTFGRSVTTSFTVVLTLTALLLFGGSATEEFVLALLIGIISGTYSSIFNASPLLVVWQEWEDRRRGRAARGPAARRVSA